MRNETHSKGCADLEAEKEEETESELRLGNGQQLIKLQNSQILNDLSIKLSHLTLQLIDYWQVLLTQRVCEISTIVTPSRLYQYKVMPFGMKNATATFQRMVKI